MMALVILLAAVGVIVSLVGGVWLIILAFRESLLWGLAALFVPFAALAFAIMYWTEAKRPFYISLVGTALTMLAAFVAVGAGVHQMVGSIGELDDSSWQAPAEDEVMVAPTAAPTLPAPAATASPSEVEDDVAELFASTPVFTPTLRPRATPTPLVDSTAEWTIRDQLEAKIGENVELRLRTGQLVSVYLKRVEDDRVAVEQRVGGGIVSYSIAIADIARIRDR
jgi:hypothetical protein